MDWLDDTLDRLLKKFNSLRGTLFLYLVFAIILTIIASVVTISLAVNWEKLILEDRIRFERWLDLLAWHPQASLIFPKRIAQQINTLEVIRSICPYVYGLLAVLIVTELFYKKRIQEPLAFLGHHIQNMREGNLDLPVALITNDDFQQLAKRFDELRQDLADQQREINLLHTEQKKINAAFSHDIRTPLAVIQNNAEMIDALIDAEADPLLEKALNKIQNNVRRLTDFSGTMQAIQKLEELPIHLKAIGNEHFSLILGTALEAFPNVKLTNRLPQNGSLLMDSQVISEALENVLANAERFAKSRINVEVFFNAGYLTIVVKDDGPGFSKEALISASAPYYSQNKESHFGLGLTICEVLTQKHGGVLKVGNAVNGGGIVTLVFKV